MFCKDWMCMMVGTRKTASLSDDTLLYVSVAKWKVTTVKISSTVCSYQTCNIQQRKVKGLLMFFQLYLVLVQNTGKPACIFKK